MTNPVILASIKIGGHPITIELVEPPDPPATVIIHWPKKRLSISTRRFPELAASLTRLFAAASMELARIKAGDRL